MIKFNSNTGLTIGKKPLHATATPTISISIRDDFGDSVHATLKCTISGDGDKIPFNQIPKKVVIQVSETQGLLKAREFYEKAVMAKIIEDNPGLKDNIHIE